MDNENLITCPGCGAEINVSEALSHQLEDQFKKEFDKKSAIKEKEIQKQLNEVQAAREQVLKEKENQNDFIAKEVETKLKLQKTTIEQSIRKQLQEETSEQLNDLQKELQEKSGQVKELNKTKAEVEKLKREKEEMRDLVVLEKEKEFSAKIKDEKLKIRKQADEENTMKIKELEKQLADQKELAEEMKRKADQGSTQLQGEVQEIELENVLRELYIYDEIVEIKKGQRGGDTLQIVKTNQGVVCGKIYYESKRTKNYDNNWIKKLRDDNLIMKADVLVLVTEAMPEGAEKFCYKDGIWVCTFWEVKALTSVLRHGLLQIHSRSVTQQGKETKMEMLYSYLTGQEFKGQFEAIMEGFKCLQNGYQDEKLKMQKIWKEREKQLEKILCNSVNFYGSLKGIAGASIPDIEMLEGEQQKSVEMKS